MIVLSFIIELPLIILFDLMITFLPTLTSLPIVIDSLLIKIVSCSCCIFFILKLEIVSSIKLTSLG